MNATLHLQLLGGFALSVGGRPLALKGGRIHALVAYLALHPDAPQSRSQIASRFWPDVPEAQGRNNLRQLVHQLRQAWPDHEAFIVSDGQAMQWRADASTRVDAVEFQRHFTIARGLRATERGRARDMLARIVGTYAGELLPDCHDEWATPLRDRLRECALGAFDLLARFAEEEHDYPAALAHAERLLELDPVEERTHLRLMRLHALNRDYAAGIRAHAACVATLERELGVAPGKEIRDAHQRLLRRSTTSSEARRIERRGDSGEVLTPFIGRAQEWQELLRAWHRAKPRGAVLALATGEAGLGKTRLGEELLLWADAQGIAVARTRAYAAEGRLAFSPITGWLRSEPVRESLSRLDPLWRTEVARLLSELIVEQPDLPRPAPLAEYGQRQMFFEALARAVTGAAPALVLLMDDLQWCDAETLEWLHYLLRFDADIRLLVIGTVRTDEVGPEHAIGPLTTALGRTDQLVEIPLAPLDAAETAKLASGVAGQELDVTSAFRLFSQTEGNPLFVVETVRAGLDAAPQESGGPPARTLPPKVHAVINGRLSQLSPDARELAALAATIGRAFSIDVLSGACDLGDLRIARALDELWQRRIVREGGSDPDATRGTWDFTHDRLREVALAEQGPLERGRRHRRIAEALEKVFAGDLDAVSAEIAAHYDQGREGARAVPYYERAARVATRVFAYDEVQALLRRALALIDRLPEPPRLSLELPLQVALAAAIRVTHGWAAPALEVVQARVVDLSRSVGNAEQRAVALINSMLLSEVRADFASVKALMAEIPAVMSAIDSPVLRAMAIHAEMGADLFQGRFTKAERIYVESTSIRDPAHHQTYIELVGVDLNVLGLAWSSHGLFCRGRTDAAFERAQEALSLARSLAHPFSETLSYCYMATLHQMNGDVDRTGVCAAQAHAISVRHRVAYYGAWAAILLAWAEASRTHGEQPLSNLRHRIDELTATGAGARLPYYLSLLAVLQAKSGTPAVAIGTLDLALETSSRNGDAWWDAEIHRLRGVFLGRTRGNEVEASAALERSLAIAREQGASLIERRTLDSMAEFPSYGGAHSI